MPFSLTWKPDDRICVNLHAFAERVRLSEEDTAKLYDFLLRVGRCAFNEGLSLHARLRGTGAVVEEMEDEKMPPPTPQASANLREALKQAVEKPAVGDLIDDIPF